MKSRIAVCLVVLNALGFAPLAFAEEEKTYQLQTGDIVFQGTKGEQADAVRLATGSPYTHCGVVIVDQGKFHVLEAVQPVRITALDEFMKRSLPGTFHARRLKKVPDPSAFESVQVWSAKQIGRNYDLKFQWSDESFYCSELVWKIFSKAGVELCPTRSFHDYNLEAAPVKAIIARRYGSAEKLPKSEPVVAPGDIAASSLLVEVPVVEGKK